MTMLRRVRSWFGAVVRRSRMEREMDAELRFHIEAFAEDLVGSGVSREEALRRARIEFGDVERLVFGQGIRPLAPGVVIGLLLALVLTRLLRAVLVGVSPSDPLTFVGIVVVLAIAATLGSAYQPDERRKSIRWWRCVMNNRE